jgi:hypothetical protein
MVDLSKRSVDVDRVIFFLVLLRVLGFLAEFGITGAFRGLLS